MPRTIREWGSAARARAAAFFDYLSDSFRPILGVLLGASMVIAIVNDDDRNPRLKCLRGDAHNIAVELGLKRGQVFKGDAGDLRLAAVA